MNTLPALRLGVAGTPEFAVPALRRLAAVSSVSAVFTQPDRPAGRGRALQMSPVKRLALELGIPVHQPLSFKTAESTQLLRALELDVLVVVAYGLILPASVLPIPRLGCVNIHASLLPRWRGAAPIQRALLAGDSSTGVTIMRMEAGLDTGPVFAARATEIGALDSAAALHDRLAAMGADLLVDTLPGIESRALSPQPQPDVGATYARKVDKTEARIDWSLDAPSILRQVRAFNSWPVAETVLNGQQLRIWDAEVLPTGAHDAAVGIVLTASAAGVDVACGQGILRILRLQLAGRKALCAAEFLKGQRLDGTRLGSA